MLAARLQRGDLFGVAQIGDVDLVELQIAAAGGAERADGLVVGRRRGRRRSRPGRDRSAVDRLAAAAEMHHRWATGWSASARGRGRGWRGTGSGRSTPAWSSRCGRSRAACAAAAHRR